MHRYFHFRGVLGNAIGRSILRILYLIYLLSLCAIPSSAYWPPLQSVQAWITGNTVHYQVFDPSRSLWMEDSSQCATSSISLYNNDGVVAWYNFYASQQCSVQYRTYDPSLSAWRGGSTTVSSVNSTTLYTSDGMVSWYCLYSNQSYIYYQVYDPALGTWQGGSATEIYLDWPVNFHMVQPDGIVLWYFRSEYNPYYRLRCQVYDPSSRTWAEGTASYADSIYNVAIINATVHYTVAGNNYILGYSSTGGGWNPNETTELTAYFIAQPTTASNPPLWVWFTDMSLAASSWSWDFGGAGSSSNRSPWFTFNDLGTYVVTETVTNPEMEDYDQFSIPIVVGTPAMLSVSPCSLTFNAIVGASNPAPQTLLIANGGNIPFNFSLVES
ncbi:MAG: PKD domain-containing protein, partial [bacterium]